MRTLRTALLSLCLVSLAGPAAALNVRIPPSTAAIKSVRVAGKLAPPKTDYTKLDKPGPVCSPDPYFTLKLGEAEVYRDAKDHSLAYYRPILHLGRRSGTPLAAGVGELAPELDGFRFRYHKFESGGSPKWADMQVIVVAERPEEATLENVQERWPQVTRLIPMPLALAPSSGVRMTIPYPARAVTFSQLEASGGTDDRRWYCFSTSTHPTPPDLLTDSDNDALNEAEARDFVALITSDLSDMPSFQPLLQVRATYPGWQGASPVLRTLVPALIAKPVQLAPAAAKSKPKPSSRPGRGVLHLPMKLAGEAITLAAAGPAGLRKMPSGVLVTPAATVGKSPAVTAAPALARAGLVRVIGTLRPRKDIDYSYSADRQLASAIPITYSKETTPHYDYYFLSDSGRFGGPYFEPSMLPDRPQRAQPPEGFSGYWYESHYLGRRLVWPAPRALRLCWNVESGLRPSCRFSLSSGEGGALTAHISYDLYPDFSTRQLSAAVASISAQTGERVELLPFTDVLDANQMSLQSGNPTLQELVAAKQLSITKLSPQAIDDAWFRVAVDLPIDDWAAFTLFMKLGELGTWDFGVLTGATTGMGEKVVFELNADLLQTMGGPAVARLERYDADDGGCEVAVDNYGLQPLAVEGLRFVLEGEEETTADIWFDGEGIDLPGVGTASSFDQSEGAGGSVAAAITVPASAELKSLMDSGRYDEMAVALTHDMVGPSTDPEHAGGADPDILFSFLRSLCYQYIGSSDLIEVPVAPAELSQWIGYRSGRIVVRFQGFVYAKELDLPGPNAVAMRRLPREGAYALAGKPGQADVLEYRAIFVKEDGTTVRLPPQPEDESNWLTGDISGINLDMTQPQ